MTIGGAFRRLHLVADAGSSGPLIGATELAMEHWTTYFQALAGAAGARVSVEIVGGTTPARAPLQARVLRAIGYGEGEDGLRIEADAGHLNRWPVRYFIANPRTIHVAERDSVAEILVRDEAGVRTLIRLFLPAGDRREDSRANGHAPLAQDVPPRTTDG